MNWGWGVATSIQAEADDIRQPPRAKGRVGNAGDEIWTGNRKR